MRFWAYLSYLIYCLLSISTIGINAIALKYWKHRWNVWLGYGIPTLGIAIVIFLFSTFHYLDLSDFTKAYYPAGRLIIEDPSSLYKDKVCYDGFVNIPIIALLFTPFSFLTQFNAEFLFILLGCFAILLNGYLLIRMVHTSELNKFLLLCAFALNGPLFNSLKLGNTTHFILLLMLLAFNSLQSKRDILAGILIAFSAIIKLPLLIFGIYFILRKRWRVSAGFMGTIVILGGVSLLLFGMDLHLSWLNQCIFNVSSKSVGAYYVQSVDGFLLRFLSSNDISKNFAPIAVTQNFKLLRYLIISLLLGITFLTFRRPKPAYSKAGENLEFLIILCLALLISPISWSHYYLLLLLPIFVYFSDILSIPRQKPWLYFILLSTVLLSLPVVYYLPYLPSNPILRFLTQRILISNYFWGGIVLFGVLLTARWQIIKLDKNSTKLNL